MPKTDTEAAIKVNKEERQFHILVANLIWLIPAAASGVVYLFFDFGQVTPSEIGQIGDFFGGWFTPLFLFFVMLLLIYSIRFQIKELTLIRNYIEHSATAQQETLNAQLTLHQQHNKQYEITDGTNALRLLVNNAEAFLNTKVNQYIDIIHFDNNSPSDIRFIHLVDGWQKEIDNNKPIVRNVRTDKDNQLIIQYLHTVHHLIYATHNLVNNKAWLHISPYIQSLTKHIKVLNILYNVTLLTDLQLWTIKQAITALNAEVIEINAHHGDDAFIYRVIKHDIKSILTSTPTPKKFKSAEQEVNEEKKNLQTSGD